MSHTPTPWKIGNDLYERNKKLIVNCDFIVAEDGRCVAEYHECGSHSMEISNDDAEFLIKACNNHEELVTALRDLVDAGVVFDGWDVIPAEHCVRALQKAIEKAKEVLVNV